MDPHQESGDRRPFQRTRWTRTLGADFRRGINILDASGARHISRLGQGGVDATSRKCREASLIERTGRLVQLPINRCLDQTAPSAPLRRLRTFSYWRSHPALTKAGNMPLVNSSASFASIVPIHSQYSSQGLEFFYCHDATQSFSLFPDRKSVV